MNKLIFGDIEVSKKVFYGSKKAVDLKEVDASQIVVSNKIKGNNNISKVFIRCINDIGDVVSPLCIILLQMSGWIKYFENGGKNVSFKIADDEVYIKYKNIWNKIKELLGDIKFYSELIYDDSYIKTKVNKKLSTCLFRTVQI